MTLTLAFLFVFAVTAVVITARAILQAREGYEDETGFHAVVVADTVPAAIRRANGTNLPGGDFAGGVA